MGGARVSVMNILLAVVVLLGLEARAQTDKICTAANKDPSHCICNTPNGAIDVTSLGDANGFTKYMPILAALNQLNCSQVHS